MHKFLTTQNVGTAAGTIGLILIWGLATKDERHMGAILILVAAALVLGYCKGLVDSKKKR